MKKNEVEQVHSLARSIKKQQEVLNESKSQFLIAWFFYQYDIFVLKNTGKKSDLSLNYDVKCIFEILYLDQVEFDKPLLTKISSDLVQHSTAHCVGSIEKTETSFDKKETYSPRLFKKSTSPLPVLKNDNLSSSDSIDASFY